MNCLFPQICSEAVHSELIAVPKTWAIWTGGKQLSRLLHFAKHWLWNLNRGTFICWMLWKIVYKAICSSHTLSKFSIKCITSQNMNKYIEPKSISSNWSVNIPCKIYQKSPHQSGWNDFPMEAEANFAPQSACCWKRKFASWTVLCTLGWKVRDCLLKSFYFYNETLIPITESSRKTLICNEHFEPYTGAVNEKHPR